MEDEISRIPSTPRRRAPRRKIAAPSSPAGKTGGAAAGGIVEDSKPASPDRQPAASRERREPARAGSINDVEMEADERELEELLASASSLRDLERLASDNPRTAVIGAVAVGFLIGFGVGLLAAKD